MKPFAALLLLVACGSPSAADDPLPAPVEAFESLQMQRLAEQQRRPEARIKPFASDGCSGGLSASWQGLARTLPGFAALLGELPPWEHCCVAHDRAYWRGDTVDGYRQRLASDQALHACVVETGGAESQRLAERLGVSTREVEEAFAVIAAAMFRAVRLGGGPCTGLPWRWGHGWPECEIEPADLIAEELLALTR